jgi:hypothetical protein
MLQHSDKYHGSVSPYILEDLCSHAERIFVVKLEQSPKEGGCKKCQYLSAQKYRRYDVLFSCDQHVAVHADKTIKQGRYVSVEFTSSVAVILFP